MQFNFLISKCMSVNENGMTILNGSQQRNPQLDEVITTMGEASAKAQNLKQVITSPSRFYQTDQKLYIKSEGKQCLGILKVGKNLFHRDLNGLVREIQPLCVLDFYVHESMQRRGIGKELFEEMLRCEIICPEKLAYDRPSPKLLGFLKSIIISQIIYLRITILLFFIIFREQIVDCELITGIIKFIILKCIDTLEN